MGTGSYDSIAFRTYISSNTGKKADEIYTSRSMSDTLNPHGVKMRESVDSDDNPNSTPIIAALDVTGSMGIIAQTIANKGLDVLFRSIIDRKPVTDPHVMFMGIGDVHFDRAPLQVSQFEADKRIIEQLKLLYLEGGGGGNNSESYNLAWYFAAMHTVHDSYNKRNKPGYLFTIGDEQVPLDLTIPQIKKVMGTDVQYVPPNRELLTMLERHYHVFHIIIEEGYHASRHLSKVKDDWHKMLGQRVISLSASTALAETIVSTIQITEGEDHSKVAASWDDLNEIVADATKSLPSPKRSGDSSTRPQLSAPS